MSNVPFHFSKEERQMANRDMKRCLAVLTIKEMQIKITMSYHHTRVTMGIIKKKRAKKCWRGHRKKNTGALCNLEQPATMEHNMVGPQKIKNKTII